MTAEPPMSDKDILEHRIDEVDEHVRYHVRKGFEALRSVPDEQLRSFQREFFTGFERGQLVEASEVASTLELDDRFVPDVTLAASLLMGALADLSATSADLFEVGKGKIFDELDERTVRSMGDEIAFRRQALQGAFRRSTISSAILPSFQSIAVEVDLRIRFGDRDNIIDGAPVVIVAVRTDSEEDFIFQMDADDVRRTIKRLEDVERRLRAGASAIEQLTR